MFDTRDPGVRGNITSIIGVVGEDLGATLFKHYEENNDKEVCIINNSPIHKRVGKRGPRLDRWIYATDKKGKTIAYQTEIKNWSAFAIGGREVNDENRYEVAKFHYENRVKVLKNPKLNNENKVLREMKRPDDLPKSVEIKSLIIYWIPLSRNGKTLEPLIKERIRGTDLAIFSMSNYLWSIKDKQTNLNLDMEQAEKRIKLLNEYFMVR